MLKAFLFKVGGKVGEYTMEGSGYLQTKIEWWEPTEGHSQRKGLEGFLIPNT